MLEQLSFFKDLSQSQLDLLRPLVESCQYKAGERIFSQGEPAKKLYWLIKGEVVVSHVPHDGPEMPLACLTAGDVLGWSAALGRRQYTASAVCVNDAEMLAINANDLQAVFLADERLGKLLLARLVDNVSHREGTGRAQVMSMLENGIWEKGNENDDNV